jgi:YfiH family protein
LADAPEAVEAIRHKALEGVPHGFLSGAAGSRPACSAGLNCGLGSGDDAAAWRKTARAPSPRSLPGAALVSVYQVHSPVCVTVIEPWGDDRVPKPTPWSPTGPGVVLGIVTADCAPVLLADREAGVVGAAHAGWKGAIAGVTDQTVAAMEALGAQRERIAAAIGPCIAQASYEVDEAFRDRFVSDQPGNQEFFGHAGRPGHWQFDLSGYVATACLRGPRGTVEELGLDTYAAARPVLLLPPRDPPRRAGLRSADFADRLGPDGCERIAKKAVGRRDIRVYQARQVGLRLPRMDRAARGKSASGGHQNH